MLGFKPQYVVFLNVESEIPWEISMFKPSHENLELSQIEFCM